jgi:abhydrolase domain-containing protein 12
LSTGFPTEEGLIVDGIATVNWALNVAKIPSDRIVIIGHSLGTAVTAATVEHFAKEEINFAGVILISGFSDLPNLLTSYSIAGVMPLLSPLGWLPSVQTLFKNHIIDAWPSAKRISNFVRWSKKVRLFIIHAHDDYEIPWRHSDALFAAATNAQIPGMVPEVFAKIKERGTVDMGDNAFISTWKAEPGKIIQEIIVAFGGE